MHHLIGQETKLGFSDFLRDTLREFHNGDFFQRRGKRFLVREFHKYCATRGYQIDEASLGRYLRLKNPVLPTPARCRALARVFGMTPDHLLEIAGYRESDDGVAYPIPEDADLEVASIP